MSLFDQIVKELVVKRQNYSLKEIEKKFGISERKLSFLIRKDLIQPVVESGKLFISEKEIKRYLNLPKKNREALDKSFLKTLGPGLITGVSDDDNSGILTYSIVGAAYGLGLTWLALYLLPMMTAVQETCARIGVVTGKGLAENLSKHLGRRVMALLVLILLVANTINIGADIGSMAVSLQLLIPINFYIAAIFFTLIMLFLEIRISYYKYAKVLKWLTLTISAYIITGFIVHPDWIMVVKSLFIPKLEFNATYIAAVVGVMGTTISPYLFFWQTSEEVEDKICNGTENEHHVLAIEKEIKEMRKDTYAGMSIANVVFLFIVITTAFVLHSHGINNINSAADAALALKPLAGNYAYLLFTVGLVGIGLLAVPVLAGASAYAISEVFKWNEGLSKKYSQAKGFYGVIIVSMVIGLLMNFIGINPIRGLYYAAIVNGISAPILMYYIFKIGRSKEVMGRFTSPRWVNIWGTIATVLMGVAAVALIVFAIMGK